MSEPPMRPKVAAAVHRVLAPSRPRSSSTGPKAPAVPCPPTMGMEPVHMPTAASTPITWEKPIAATFWRTISAVTQTRKIRRLTPPLFSTFRLAWKPTEVKNITIHTVFSVSSKDISMTPAA